VVQNGCDQVFRMKIRIGFEMIYDFPQPTPLIALVGTHFTRSSDILAPDYLLPDNQPFRANHALSRWLRQLVQSDRRARRPRAPRGRRDGSR
jgi:hypothetical protein